MQIGMNGQGILPTPDPTIASCISDEDVALQLMRLGDASNISHGRTSASTLDDAFSGVADAASSTGATSESEEESDGDGLPLPTHANHRADVNGMLPPVISNKRKRVDDNIPSNDSTEFSGDDVDGDEDYDEKPDALIKSEAEDYVEEANQDSVIKMSKAKPLQAGPIRQRSSNSSTKNRTSKARSNPPVKRPKLQDSGDNGRAAPSANGAAPQPRKNSNASGLNFQHHLATDEEDLSSKPRCQRCRKSKKGCDRQRPCQRCKDAGIGIEGCVSEEETSGRKGRYGRHMGVPVKRTSEGSTNNEGTSAPGLMAPPAMINSDKNKKKRKL